MVYIYNNITYTNYLGNYWDDYNGSDANGDGIGDVPYIIPGDTNDSYPLMQPWENYITPCTPSFLSVLVQSPSEKFVVSQNNSISIKVKVTDNCGYSVSKEDTTVTATFSNGDPSIELFDDGSHNDGATDDGVYSNNWTPQNIGACPITVTAMHTTLDSGYDEVSGNVTAQAPDIAVSQNSWNFGTVTQGTQQNQTFIIENTGNANLTVSSITPSCSCIYIAGLALPVTIAPGSSETFNASIDTSALSGEVSETITISSNDPDEPTTTILINGTVTVGELAVKISTDNATYHPNEQVILTINVTKENQPVSGASVSYSVDGTSIVGSGMTNTSGLFTDMFTAPSNAGTYLIRANASKELMNGTGIAKFDVLENKSISAIVITDKTSYTIGEDVTVTVYVKDYRGDFLTGADVSGFINKPFGSGSSPLTFAESSEAYEAIYSISLDDASGMYEVNVTATKEGYTSDSSSIRFTVDAPEIALSCSVDYGTWDQQYMAWTIGDIMQGMQANATMRIANTGEGDLIVSGVDTNAEWITIPDDPSGTIQPGNFVDFHVKVDTSGLDLKKYNKVVTVHSNAGDPLAKVYVSVVEKSLAVSVSTLDTMTVGEDIEAKIAVKDNLGSEIDADAFVKIQYPNGSWTPYTSAIRIAIGEYAYDFAPPVEGIYKIDVKAEKSGYTPGYDEKSFEAKPIPEPDIEVVSRDVTMGSNPSELRVTLTVKNQGAGTSEKIWIRDIMKGFAVVVPDLTIIDTIKINEKTYYCLQSGTGYSIYLPESFDPYMDLFDAWIRIDGIAADEQKIIAYSVVPFLLENEYEFNSDHYYFYVGEVRIGNDPLTPNRQIPDNTGEKGADKFTNVFLNPDLVILTSREQAKYGIERWTHLTHAACLQNGVVGYLRNNNNPKSILKNWASFMCNNWDTEGYLLIYGSKNDFRFYEESQEYWWYWRDINYYPSDYKYSNWDGDTDPELGVGRVLPGNSLTTLGYTGSHPKALLMADGYTWCEDVMDEIFNSLLTKFVSGDMSKLYGCDITPNNVEVELTNEPAIIAFKGHGNKNSISDDLDYLFFNNIHYKSPIIFFDTCEAGHPEGNLIYVFSGKNAPYIASAAFQVGDYSGAFSKKFFELLANHNGDNAGQLFVNAKNDFYGLWSTPPDERVIKGFILDLLRNNAPRTR